MMEKILVEVGYYDFYFSTMDAALVFARTAKMHITDDVTVKLTANFVKAEEETSEDGED